MEAGRDGPAGEYRRRDYERNREAILSAATACFMESGAKVPIDAIAKRAGVGAATVYRHFPSRNDLSRAVFDLRIGAYADAIDEAQRLEDPAAAFRETIHAIARLQATDRAFRELMSADFESFTQGPGVARFAAALQGAFVRAEAEDVTRPDVKSEDVMLLLISTEGIARKVSELSENALARIVDIILDGICGSRTGLQGAALEAHELLDVAKG